MPFLGQAAFPTRTAEAYFGDETHRPHLCLVVSDPEVNADEVVFLSVTSAYDGCDRSCLLGPDGHPALTHESCVHYRLTQRMKTTSAAITAAWDRGWFVERADLSANTLKLVQQGAFESIWTAPWATRVLTQQGFAA